MMLMEEEFDPKTVINLEELFDSTLSKLNTIQKLELLMTVFNFTTKTMAIYLVFVNYSDVFANNSLLLFCYLLYAFLEVFAFGSSLALILIAKFIKLVFQKNLYLLDSFVCLPILYVIFKFCLIVTFFIQSVVLMLFCRFSHWQYPILLGISLVSILGLQFLRVILILSGKFNMLPNCFEWIFKFIAPEKLNKAYAIVRYIINSLYARWLEIDTKYKDFDAKYDHLVSKAQEATQQAIDMKENYDTLQKYIPKKKVPPPTTQTTDIELSDAAHLEPLIKQ